MGKCWLAPAWKNSWRRSCPQKLAHSALTLLIIVFIYTSHTGRASRTCDGNFQLSNYNKVNNLGWEHICKQLTVEFFLARECQSWKQRIWIGKSCCFYVRRPQFYAWSQFTNLHIGYITLNCKFSVVLFRSILMTVLVKSDSWGKFIFIYSVKRDR